MKKVLIIGASGNVGSKVVKELDRDHSGLEVVLATSRQETADKWNAEGKPAVVLNLNDPDTFPKALEGINRLFLLTGYTAEMLIQAKMLVDAAKDAGVEFIIHLGTYTSRRDPIPHFNWHDLIESYIAASGIAWTNVHPNVITDSILSMIEIKEDVVNFVTWGDVPQGYACAKDIAAVLGTVLREGEEKHSGKDYYLSIDVLTGSEMASMIGEVTGKPVNVHYQTLDEMRLAFDRIPSNQVKAYMDSAIICAKLTQEQKFKAQTAICDDVLTVTGHPGTPMQEWMIENLNL